MILKPQALKPQDVLVVLKLVALNGRSLTYKALARALFMSASEVHAAIERAQAARLLNPHQDSGRKPVRKSLLEFLIHGVKYVYLPKRGMITRGIPTAHAAPPLAGQLMQSKELPPVWPYAHGQIRGYSFLPLYYSVPDAALHDPALYELLALTDALRDGGAREKNLATDLLTQRIAP
ncbi:MAG: hypothetical protein GY862_23620 [Gammaproteobacteria bacterium]|nr:hypothetical protein [Gammaproteobacteria bacterium]